MAAKRQREQTWICRGCSTENDGKFCKECGINHSKCPSCDFNRLDSEDKYCRACGTSLTKTIAMSSTQSSSKASKKEEESTKDIRYTARMLHPFNGRNDFVAVESEDPERLLNAKIKLTPAATQLRKFLSHE